MWCLNYLAAFVFLINRPFFFFGMDWNVFGWWRGGLAQKQQRVYKARICKTLKPGHLWLHKSCLEWTRRASLSKVPKKNSFSTMSPLVINANSRCSGPQLINSEVRHRIIKSSQKRKLPFFLKDDTFASQEPHLRLELPIPGHQDSAYLSAVEAYVWTSKNAPLPFSVTGTESETLDTII